MLEIGKVQMSEDRRKENDFGWARNYENAVYPLANKRQTTSGMPFNFLVLTVLQSSKHLPLEHL